MEEFLKKIEQRPRGGSAEIHFYRVQRGGSIKNEMPVSKGASGKLEPHLTRAEDRKNG